MQEGEKKYAKRCSSFKSILSGTTSSSTPCRYDASLASHFSFFMGDLNFRTKLTNAEPGSPEHIQICHDLVAHRDWVTLNKYDELSYALRKKECLVGFRTPYCNFDPTFKVSREAGYSYNIKRSPSYTDRILFKTGDQLEPALTTLLYEPVSNFVTSDHKPIRGAFEIALNEKLGESGSTKQVLHIFVSSIECDIKEEEYIQTRQGNDVKVELPSTFVAFISTPVGAVRPDDARRGNTWKSFGLGGLRKIKNKAVGESSKKKSSWMSLRSS